MKIAVVGAGFAGVALSYYLQSISGISVTLIDKQKIAAGASGASCGLMHPYVGEQVRRSQLASEGFKESKELMEKVLCFSETPFVDFSGIERIAQTDEQINAFCQHEINFKDVTRIGPDRFFIHQAATVQTTLYLQALWKACEKLGATFVVRSIDNTSDLKDFDNVIFCCGAGVFEIEQFKNYRLDSTRGQALVMQWPSDVPEIAHSLVSKGYLAKTFEKGIVNFGATFERKSKSLIPDKQFAENELRPKLESILPNVYLNCIGVKAGIRVSSVGHYFPLIGPTAPGNWIYTGLGSRGLLYHALFAKMLSKWIVFQEDQEVPDITKLLLSKNKQLSYNKY